MSTEELKGLMLRSLELFNQGDLEAYAGLLAADCVYCNPNQPAMRARDEYLQLLSGLRAAFPNLRFELEELLTEGDLARGRAAVRAQMRGTLQGMWRGVQGAGQTVDVTFMMFMTVIDGKLAEIWNLGDMATLAQQLSPQR